MSDKTDCKLCLNCRNASTNADVMPKIDSAVNNLISAMAELEAPILQAEVLARVSASFSFVNPKINKYAKGIAEQLAVNTAAYFYDDKDFFDEINKKGFNHTQVTVVSSIEKVLELNPQWVEHFNAVKAENVKIGKRRLELFSIIDDRSKGEAERKAAVEELLAIEGLSDKDLSLQDIADSFNN